MEPITVPRFLGGWWIPDVALAGLRIAIAALLAVHGLREHFGLFLPGTQTWLGAPILMSDRWLAAAALLVGATLLAAGAFARVASLGLAIVVVLGYFAPQRARGHWTLNGTELVALHASVLAAFALIGPGLFSVDALRAGRHRARQAGPTVSMSPWIRRQYRHRELTR